MNVFQFDLWSKKFCVDVESGNFFEVDKLASDIIKLMPQLCRWEIIAALKARHSLLKVAKALDRLAILERKKMLFSCRQKPGPALKRKITDLTLNIVNTCNLSCRYCWNRQGAYAKAAGSKKMMPPEVAFRAVDLLLEESRGTDDLVVDFYGGEPLLNFALIKAVIAYCRKVEQKRKVHFRFLLATNGTLLNRERGEFLIDNGVDIAVSLDGEKIIQDTQRPFPDGKGSYSVIMNNLNELRPAYRRRIVGRATFTPLYPDIIKTFRFLRKLGFERIEVCESEKAGYGLESRSSFFFSGNRGLRQLKILYESLARFYTREIIKGRLTYENTYFNRFFKQLSRLYHIQSIVGACSAGFSLMAVDIDGKIYPCTAFVGIPQFNIGTIKSGVSEIKLKKFFAGRVSSGSSCSRCWARRICRGCGSCYNLNYFSNKNLGHPDPYYCELFRYKTQLMIGMIAKIGQEKPGRLNDLFIPEYYAARGNRKSG
ncbi:MAG: radical SAM protein [Candidatus Omnitrophota bacterium]